MIDQSGKIIRLLPEEIRTMGRQAQGVRLIRLDEDQKVGAIFAFVEEVEEPKDTPIAKPITDIDTEINIELDTELDTDLDTDLKE